MDVGSGFEPSSLINPLFFRTRTHYFLFHSFLPELTFPTSIIVTSDEIDQKGSCYKGTETRPKWLETCDVFRRNLFFKMHQQCPLSGHSDIKVDNERQVQLFKNQPTFTLYVKTENKKEPCC